MVAATVVALASRGDALLLALLLGLAAGRTASGTAAGLALGAASVRWGTTSLGGFAGAQAVLGPAAITGSSADVAASWSAAVALVLAARATGRPRWLAGIPFGLAAAAVVCGPGPGGALAARAGASVVAVALAGVAAETSGRSHAGRSGIDRIAAGAALAAGAAALVLAVVGR